MPIRKQRTTHALPQTAARRRIIPRLLLPVLLAACALALQAQSTALDRYVAAPDPSYAFRLIRSATAPGVNVYFLELTSQTWMTPAEVDRPVWKHTIILYVPAQPVSTTAILIVNGGSNDGPAAEIDSSTATAAATIRSVVADLRMIPNQPLTFTGESKPRSEDSIIAYSWDKFLRGRGETWPLHLPMTKATVRAMDAITAFSASADGGRITVDRYLLFGGSKRGWTSWLTAAVDRRIVAVVPAVTDLLNLEPSFRHHWQSYGLWTPALSDYVQSGVMAWFGSTPMRNLLGIVDPYEYRQRFTMPKYLINAAGDQYFHPASSRFYFDDLPGPKYLWYVPNASHMLEEKFIEVFGSGFAWAANVIGGRPLPRFTWEMPADGRIVLTATDPPSDVKLWQATNPEGRDFRIEAIGPAWKSSTVTSSGNGVYEALVPAPSKGWSAFYLEVTYPSGLIFPLKFSTPLRIAPDTLPFRAPVASVLAASFQPLTAAEAIVSAFGTDMAEKTEAATAVPLPVQLGQTTVKVTDQLGVQRNAQLFFVSPGQTNFLVPAGSAAGPGTVEVLRNGTRVSQGQLLIDPLAPGLFSANGSGLGIAAAIALTVKADGTQEGKAIADAAGRAVPVSLGAEGARVFLSLYGTGMRKAGAGASTATVGGQAVGVAGPVPAPGFPGLDQVNLGPLPLSLARAGEVAIVLTVDGVRANEVKVAIQ